MAYLNPEESLKRDKNTLGEELGELYNFLKKAMFSLQIKYQMFEALYGTETSVEMLNKFAPDFFGYIQDIIFDDIILHIHKLFSNPGKGDRRVLSFHCLSDLISEKTVRENIEEILKEHRGNLLFTQMRRNKYIAHFDDQFFLDKKEIDISIKYKDINKIIDSMWSILDCIESYYFNTSNISRYVYSSNFTMEKLFYNIKYFNSVGLRKIMEIASSK